MNNIYKFEIDDIVTRKNNMLFNDNNYIAIITDRGLRFGSPCYGLNSKQGEGLYWMEDDFDFIMKG